jgi:hypothetical protein
MIPMVTLLKSRTPRLALAALVAAAALAAAAMPAAAQTPPPAAEPLRPPTPGRPDKPPSAWNYMALVVIGGLVLGASLIPSKRGHQD